MTLTMKTLFNPFQEIGGSKALFYGLVAMLVTGIIGYLSRTHFPDVISIKYIPGQLPLSYFFIQQLIIWLIPSVFFYLLALMGSSSSVRVIDIFGTQALARYPYIIAAFIGFSDSLQKFADYIMAVALENDMSATLSVWDITMAIVLIIVSLLLAIWLVALMYNAFRISANLKGGKAVGLFIAGLVGSVLASIYAGMQLYKFLG